MDGKTVLILVFIAGLVGFKAGAMQSDVKVSWNNKTVYKTVDGRSTWSGQSLDGVTVDGSLHGDTFHVEGVDSLEAVMGTGSMRPTMFEGNTLLLRKYDGQRLEKGNIVVVEDAGVFSFDGPWIHRVVEVGDEEIVTQGDNNVERDEPVDKSDVQYVVVGTLYSDGFGYPIYK